MKYIIFIIIIIFSIIIIILLIIIILIIIITSSSSRSSSTNIYYIIIILINMFTLNSSKISFLIGKKQNLQTFISGFFNFDILNQYCCYQNCLRLKRNSKDNKNSQINNDEMIYYYFYYYKNNRLNYNKQQATNHDENPWARY